jgi:hypothetical protein
MRLPLSQPMDRPVPLFLILAAQQAAGPATQGLADLLIQQLQ